jgi:hypothetical protein
MIRLSHRRALPVAVVAGSVLLLLAGEFLFFQGRQEERTAAWADRLVAAKLEAAEAHMSHGEWDEALHLLHAALETDKARNQDGVQAALLRAQRGQATALFVGARAAVGRKDPAAALELLRAYRAHPQALDPTAATRLQDDVQRATEDARAVALLARWSDEALALFVQAGQLAAEDWKGDDGAGEIFKDTLRRHLGAEQHRRKEQREARRREAERRAAEQAAQEARMRGSAPFRDLLAFVADRRNRLAGEMQLARRREEALAQLFQQIDTDAAERERIRAGLTADRREAHKEFVESVARRRAEAKQAIRRLADFTPAAIAVFDRLADQELDTLLKERGDF